MRNRLHQFSRRHTAVSFAAGGAGLALLSGMFFFVPALTSVSYTAPGDENGSTATTTEPATPEVAHLETPASVRGLYMTSCVAGTPSLRQKMVSIAEETEINSLIIDIKDYTGGVSFSVEDERIAPAVGHNCYVGDMQEFIADLHERGIYVIGRITVFQDPHLAERKPGIAIKRSAEPDSPIWRDRKGLAYLDPGARYAWDYHVALAEASYDIGFDEINFDYIRFPTDGDTSQIYFPVSQARVESDSALGMAETVTDFFAYLDENLSDEIVTSADLFGVTTTSYYDVGIGQILEYAAPHFDYIAPMVYPSHWPSGFNGWADPNDHPGGVIARSMGMAARRLTAFANATTTATSTRQYAPTPFQACGVSRNAPDMEQRIERCQERVGAHQLRPWLQDFDYGGDYDVAEVRAQIQATYDVGLDSWMLWAPRNVYTEGALEPHYQGAEAGQ